MNEPIETFYLHSNKGHYFLERDINKCLSKKIIKILIFDDHVEASFADSFNEALEKLNSGKTDPFMWAKYDEDGEKRSIEDRDKIRRSLGI